MLGTGKNKFIVAVVLVAVIALGVLMLLKRGSGKERAFVPPFEKAVRVETPVGEKTLAPKAKPSGGSVSVVTGTPFYSVVQAVPRVVKPVALSVTVAPKNTPTVQASPARITRVKTY